MGKIGDLIVRLQLKYQDYEKGLKKAEKDTKGFATNLHKGVNLVKTAWAAVGVAVVAAAKTMVTEMAKASNNVGDFMAVKARQISAVWQTTLTSITTGFDNFLKRADASIRAAKALQEMKDAEYEMLNSVALRRAEVEQQLVQLEIDSKNPNKSLDERKKAAEEYLAIQKELYQIEIGYYKELARQSTATWLQSASNPHGAILGYSESNAGALYQFLKDYGADTGLQDAVKNYREAWKSAGELWNRTESGKKALRWVNENRQDWGQTNYRRFALDLGWAYEEQKNDELNGQKLVKNIETYLNKTAAYISETKKMQNNLNSLSAQIDKSAGGLELSDEVQEVESLGLSLEKLSGITSQAFVMTMPDIIPDDWLERNRDKIDAALAEAMRLQAITEEINRSLENAVVNSLSSATQAFIDCVAGIEGADASQVLAALLQPFASTMIQLGEFLIVEGLGIKAFEESLKSLDWKVALAAGSALLILGASLSAGIRKLGSSFGSSGSSGGSTSYSGGNPGGASTQNYESTLTVEVKGRISGNDIVLSGQKTVDQLGR